MSRTVVLETSSTRQLVLLAVAFLLGTAGFFLVGGLLAPKPHNVQVVSGRECFVNKYSKDAWVSVDNLKIKGTTILPCMNEENATPNSEKIIVFHLPKFRQVTTMSRYFVWMLGLLQFESTYHPNNQYMPGARMKLDIKFSGISLDMHELHEIGHSVIEREVSCKEPMHRELGYPYECDSLPLFDHGSVYYPYYLFNIRLPVDDDGVNHKLGEVNQWEFVVIHPDERFTLLWLVMKTILFPITLVALIWYKRNSSFYHYGMDPALLESQVFYLGVFCTILNAPIDWLSIIFDFRYMLLVTDLRQGVFFVYLMVFWLVFCGEHRPDARGTLHGYWKHLSFVGAMAICLFVFDLCERGVQLYNPFYSVWSDPVSSAVATTFIVIASLAAAAFFVLLCYNAFAVVQSIRRQAHSANSLSTSARKRYFRLRQRFFVVLGLTLVAACLSVCFFVVGRLSETQWQWQSAMDDDGALEDGEDEGDGPHLMIEYGSAFMTGVYGLWNCYVLLLLYLYSPTATPMAEDADDALEMNEANQSDNRPLIETEAASFSTVTAQLTGFIKAHNETQQLL